MRTVQANRLIKSALAASVSAAALSLWVSAARADNIGTVDVQAAPAASTASANAIGKQAVPGTAPALAPSQGSLDMFQPGSTVSDKVIQDISAPGADYNEILKFTPNFITTNTNGALGDTKSSWRGFVDGQYNITFDGIPFGDFNDPTHHSNAYFPAAFLCSATVNRGPGQADQFGYATFGGTLALDSCPLSDKFNGSLTGSIGTWGTYTGTMTVQSGLLDKSGTKLLFQYSHQQTDGALNYANVIDNYGLLKLQHQFGDFLLTGLATVGHENYNNANPITMLQFNLYGKSYGQLNNNPKTQQFIGYNNSVKQTDMEYLQLNGSEMGWNLMNRVYTYSYWYPSLQNNGNDQTNEVNAGTKTSTFAVSPTKFGYFITQGIATNGTTVTFPTVGAKDVTGYLKDNNYRAWGDMFTVTKDVKAGVASGQLNFGAWYEYASNDRLQEYYDYTQGALYSGLPTKVTGTNNQTVLNAAFYKLDLSSTVRNFQPYIEYHWQPTAQLTITPGLKYEYFERDHNALVNQTTLLPTFYSADYTTTLPYLDVRYRATPELTLYAQASGGFLAPTVSAYYVTNFANSNIQPERTTNFQAGAIYKSEKFTVDGDIYRIDANNFPVTTTLSDGSQTYYNAGTARYQGIEGEGTYVLTKGLAAYASGALASAQFVSGPNSGLGVGDAPGFTFAGGLIYDDNQHWFGSALFKVQGAMYGSAGQCGVNASTPALCAVGAASLNRVPSFNETDLVVGYRTEIPGNTVFKKAELRLGVNNVFDTRSIVDIGGDPTSTGAVVLGGPNVAGGALTYSFQPGRYVYAQAKLDF